jgi:ADP-ribosyl-[dinitrogen reductase] hydrolase
MRKEAEMSIDNLSRAERIRGGLYGLLVGDALGVPYEFHDSREIPDEHAIEMVPPHGFRRAHAGVPSGTWSDDGAQALCLLNSLSRNTSLDLDDFGAELLAWYETGHMTPDGNVFDVGIQTRRALHALIRGVAVTLSGPSDEYDNGNGALMRCLPVAFVATSTDIVVDLAMRQGIVTHGHARSKLCCALYALTAAGVLEGLTAKEALTRAETQLRRQFVATPYEREMEIVLGGRSEAPRGSGYVVDSLWSAMHCLLSTSNYEACVRRAIMLGNDTDTTACIAGGIAGLLYGCAGIPTRWLDALKGKKRVEELLLRAQPFSPV